MNKINWTDPHLRHDTGTFGRIKFLIEDRRRKMGIRNLPEKSKNPILGKIIKWIKK